MAQVTADLGMSALKRDSRESTRNKAKRKKRKDRGGKYLGCEKLHLSEIIRSITLPESVHMAATWMRRKIGSDVLVAVVSMQPEGAKRPVKEIWYSGCRYTSLKQSIEQHPLSESEMVIWLGIEESGVNDG